MSQKLSSLLAASVELHILYKHGAGEVLLALAVRTAEKRVGMAVTTAAEGN